MQHIPGRRQLFQGMAAVGVAAVMPASGFAARKGPALSLGYATLTWGDENARQAITDIAAAGFRGIQLRAQSLKLFASPAELKQTLARARLTLACLSGGTPRAEPAAIEEFLASARFAQAAGALAIQATAPSRPPGKSAVDPGALKAFAAVLDEVGKRTAALGLPLGFHPSANQYGRTEAELKVILDSCDPRHVKLLLDTGHHAAGGGDPAQAIRTYASRLLLVHLKDVKPRPAPDDKGEDYEFKELGEGNVDFKSVLAALAAVKFRGWAIVEMRPYTVTAEHSAKDGALANRRFLTGLGLKA